MHHDRQEIEQGMNLAAELPEVMPDEADERVGLVYKDIQWTLRVPFVNLIFRSLANYPDYLEPAWAELSSILRTQAFERVADEVRAVALLDSVPPMPNVDWERLEDLEKIRAFNNTIHYVLPKLLLIVTAWDEMSLGHSTGDEHRNGAEGTSAIPLGVAEGTTKVQMVAANEADERVRELFERIKVRHGHPLVSSYYRALGNWPEFLQTVWEWLEPLVGSPSYEESKDAVIRRAHHGMQTLPVAGFSELDLNEKQRAEIRSILVAFRLKFIPEMLVDVTLIKALLDGLDQARTSPFSVAA